MPLIVMFWKFPKFLFGTFVPLDAVTV